MKKTLILLAVFCIIFISSNGFNYFTCNNTITIHSDKNAQGKFCGPTSGTFTTDSNGTAVITGICEGTYTICVVNIIGYVTINGSQSDGFYDYYTNGNNLHNPPVPCPCDN